MAGKANFVDYEDKKTGAKEYPRTHFSGVSNGKGRTVSDVDLDVKTALEATKNHEGRIKNAEDSVGGNTARINEISMEVNTYNVSAIFSSAYVSLSTALAALDGYFKKNGLQPRIGMEIVFYRELTGQGALVESYEKKNDGPLTDVSSWEKTPRRALKQLLCGMDTLGNAKALSVDVEYGYSVCGHPAVLYGHGTPSAETIPSQKGIPAFIGQEYINLDVSSDGKYYAKGTHSVSDWTK